MSILRVGSHVAALLLIATASAFAQTTGTICGTVTDPSGTGMPLVFATLTGPTLTAPAVVTSDSKGDFLFATVPLGTYTLSFEHEGFKKVARPGLIIAGRFELRADQRMAVSTYTEIGPPNPTNPPFVSVAYERPPVTSAIFTKTIISNGPRVAPRPCTSPR